MTTWYQQMTSTLDALEARANPGTEVDIAKLAELGSQLQTLTARVPDLSAAEKTEADPHMPALMARIQHVMDLLEKNRDTTRTALSENRHRQTAFTAYGKK